jgi:hypothetical protein
MKPIGDILVTYDESIPAAEQIEAWLAAAREEGYDVSLVTEFKNVQPDTEVPFFALITLGGEAGFLWVVYGAGNERLIRMTSREELDELAAKAPDYPAPYDYLDYDG